LKLTLPAFVMNSAHEAAVWQFAARHPRVAVTLHSTDQQIDLVAEGYDLAIRLGNMKASALMSRKIGTFERRLVAAPEYLALVGPLDQIADLARCDFVAMERLPDGITLIRGNDTVEVAPERSRVQVNSVGAARSAVLAGLGLQRLPMTEIEDDLATGRLVHVLPDWRLPDLGVYAVWPETGKRSALTRRLVSHLVGS
jgi:DNA-binding transcriptional LysR family regulator